MADPQTTALRPAWRPDPQSEIYQTIKAALQKDGLLPLDPQTPADTEKLRSGLAAAIRAAELALFLLERRGVEMNDSWRAGFARDMATAKDALAHAR